MYTEEAVLRSRFLDCDMHMMIYGGGGLPLLAFPTQDSPCRNWEDFGMIDTLRDFLEEGRVRIFCPDTVDRDSWSARGRDESMRAGRQEQYFRFITEEAVPFITARTGGRLPLTTGLSMGANHALICFLRRPELFEGVLALSGVYDSDVFFDGWMDATLYMNSPERFLPNMSGDHPYVEIYNQKKIVLCVGQGAWEEDGVRTLKHLQHVFREKGIAAWCDFWGADVNHDWPWWYKQMRYFLPIILGDA